MKELEINGFQALFVLALSKDLRNLKFRFFFNTSSEVKAHEIRWNCEVDRIEQVDLQGNKIVSVNTEKGSNGQILTKLSLPQFGFQTLKLIKVRLK